MSGEDSETLLARAVAHHQKGELRAATALYQKILATQPEHAESLHYLGMLRFQSGDFSVALPLVERSVKLRPGQGSFRTNLGIVLAALGRVNEAIGAYMQAVAMAPGAPEPHYNLGRAYEQVGHPEAAIAAYQKAVALRPQFAAAWGNLGVALRAQGRWQEAVHACREALALGPRMPGVRSNLANALGDCGQFAEAIRLYRDELGATPNHAETWSSLGLALRGAGRLDEALDAAARAVALAPDLPLAHWNLSHVLLLTGALAQGWREYEWRWRTPGFPSKPRDFVQPLWQGEDLDGRTILLHAEQGFGDTLQFVRYAPLVAMRGGRVILECQAPLARLLESVAGVEQVVAAGTALPDFDVQVPLLSLPGIFATTLQSIPANVPYLGAPADAMAHWAARLKSDGRLRVGLAWSGNPRQKYAPLKNVPVESLAPLLARTGVQFFNLQVGPAAADLARLGAGTVVDLAPELTDFAETAAAISQLDLVIGADTVVAHLAGALGRPAWVMLQAVPDWRWLMSRDDCPWYPSLTLFRRAPTGDWSAVAAQVEAALAQRLAA